MAATNQLTNRITIADFKPGIFGDYHAGTAQQSIVGPAMNGAAVIEDTWGCVADRSGALVPLPKVSTAKTHTLPGTAGSYLANAPGRWLLDALVVDGIQRDNTTPPTDPEVVTMQSFGYTTDGTNFFGYNLVRRWKDWQTANASDDVSFTKAAVDAFNANVMSGNLTHARGAADGEETFITGARKGFAWVATPMRRTNVAVYPPADFATGTIPAGDQALTDFDTKYAIGGAWPDIAQNAIFGFWPNFNSPFTIFPSIPGFLSATGSNRMFMGAYMCLSHQGRVVVAQRFPSQYEPGSPNSTYAWKDRISATGLLRMPVDGGGGEFVEENTSGIGVMASLSADELLVVKHSGGGYLLRGSVGSPTVVKLPFIESTYGVVASPVATPLGLVYGTRNGVFVWNGGETTQQLSPQLDGFFWNHAPGVDYDGHRGRFGWWHPWVLAPNGFIFDTRGQGWWRLDNPTGHLAYNVYAVSEQGKLFAFPYRVDATNSILYRTATPDVLADAWSWKSQPIVETRDQAFKVRDVQILATAADAGSTVTVTISGFDETGALVTIPALTFTLGAVTDRPQMQTKDVGAQASALTYVQVKVTAAGAGGLPAPKLHSISIGTVDTNPIPKAA